MSNLKWIKASERLPNKMGFYFARSFNFKTIMQILKGCNYKLFCTQGQELRFDDYPKLEWLEELPPLQESPVSGKEERIKKITVEFDGPFEVDHTSGLQQVIAMIPALPGMVVSGETKQEAWKELITSLKVLIAYNSGITSAELKELDSTPAASPVNVEAVEFTVWVAIKTGLWFDDETLLWTIPNFHTEEWYAEHGQGFPTNQFRYTTKELYNIFKAGYAASKG